MAKGAHRHTHTHETVQIRLALLVFADVLIKQEKDLQGAELQGQAAHRQKFHRAGHIGEQSGLHGVGEDLDQLGDHAEEQTAGEQRSGRAPEAGQQKRSNQDHKNGDPHPEKMARCKHTCPPSPLLRPENGRGFLSDCVFLRDIPRQAAGCSSMAAWKRVIMTAVSALLLAVCCTMKRKTALVKR